MSQPNTVPLPHRLARSARRLLQTLRDGQEARMTAQLRAQREALKDLQEQDFRRTFTPRSRDALLEITRQALLASQGVDRASLDRRGVARVFQTPLRAQQVLNGAHNLEAVIADVNEHIRSTHGLFDVCELVVQAAQRQRAARMTSYFVVQEQGEQS